LLLQRQIFLVIVASTLIVTVSMGAQEVFALWYGPKNRASRFVPSCVYFEPVLANRFCFLFF
jgi:hypothetical protein